MENNPPAPAAPAPDPAPQNPPPSAPAPAPSGPGAPPPAASAVVNGETEAEIALKKKLRDAEMTIAEKEDQLSQLKKLQSGAPAPAAKKRIRLTFFDEEES